MNRGGGVGLEIVADRLFGFAQESRRVGAFNLIEMPLNGDGRPVQEVAATLRAVERHLIRAKNQAGVGVSGITHAGHVAPGIGGIAGVNADAVAMHAAGRFAEAFLGGRASVVAEHQLVCGERKRLSHGGRRHAFRKRGGHGVGGLRRRRFEKRLAHFIDPLVLGGAGARRAAQQLVLLQHFRQQRARLVPGGVAITGFRLEAVAHRLAEQRVRLLLADDVEHVPAAVGENHAVYLRVVLHGVEQVIESVFRRNLRERGKGLFRTRHVFASHGVAQRFAADAIFDQRGRLDGMQHFVLASAFFLDAIRVSVKHLEHGQRLQFLGQLLRHAVGGRQRHHCVEADVVFAAEGARIGQRGGSDEFVEVGAGFQLVHERG